MFPSARPLRKFCPRLLCPWSTQTEPEPNNLLISLLRGRSLKPFTFLMWRQGFPDVFLLNVLCLLWCFKTNWPLWFQNGRELESSSVLQDPQDFLWQVWRTAPNLQALSGRLKQIFKKEIHCNWFPTSEQKSAYSFKFVLVIHSVSNKSTVSYLDQLIGQRHALDFKDLKLHQNVSPLFYENFFMGKGFLSRSCSGFKSIALLVWLWLGIFYVGFAHSPHACVDLFSIQFSSHYPKTWMD